LKFEIPFVLLSRDQSLFRASFSFIPTPGRFIPGVGKPLSDTTKVALRIPDLRGIVKATTSKTKRKIHKEIIPYFLYFLGFSTRKVINMPSLAPTPEILKVMSNSSLLDEIDEAETAVLEAVERFRRLQKEIDCRHYSYPRQKIELPDNLDSCKRQAQRDLWGLIEDPKKSE